MRKVHEKSILLGIGMGMIITAIAGMIFSTGTQKELSKEEIINIAKTKYGLVEQVQFLNGDSASNNSTNSSTKSSSNESTASESSTAQSTKAIDSSTSSTVAVKKQSDSTSSKRDIIIEINDGYKSQDIIDQLLEKGVISNKEQFTAVLNSYQVTTKIRVGTFKFRKNDDLDYIVKTICKLK